MVKKYADHPNWDLALEKTYKQKYFLNNDFKGYVGLISLIKAKEKVYSEDTGKCILDDGYKWIEFYPDEFKNIVITASFDDKKQLIGWYFDIAKDTKLTEAGIPYIDDLYIDVTMDSVGIIKILDEDELKEALEINDISKEDYDFAYRVTNDLVKYLNNNFEKIKNLTIKYFNIIDRIGEYNYEGKNE